jgi:hypothetical protein
MIGAVRVISNRENSWLVEARSGSGSWRLQRPPWQSLEFSTGLTFSESGLKTALLSKP